jgi:hypothetical protein
VKQLLDQLPKLPINTPTIDLPNVNVPNVNVPNLPAGAQPPQGGPVDGQSANKLLDFLLSP